MTEKKLTEQGLSKAFSNTPDDATRFGVWEGEHDVKRFIKIIESAAGDHTSSTIPSIPKSIEEYNFPMHKWESSGDLMNIVNSTQFTFFDTDQECQNAILDHETRMVETSNLTAITQHHDGI